MTLKTKKGHDFKIFWLKERADCNGAHQLFVKLHNIKKVDPKFPKGHTLFMLNVPPTATRKAFEDMIKKSFPSVSLVEFISQNDAYPSGFKAAYVVFKEESDVTEFLSLPNEFVFTLYTDASLMFGIKKWCMEYNNSLPNEEQLKKDVNSYMKKYDKLIRLKKLKDLEAEQEDEEGWVTVTGKKKRGKSATARKESVMKKIQEKKEIKENKQKCLVNMFPFQIREENKKRLIELRKKFELDKAKLQKYKQNRKFKPL